MKEIILKMGSPKEAAQVVLLLYQSGFTPHTATISYSIREKLPVKIRKLADYPLVLEGIFNGHELRVAVTPLAVGSSCEGSYALKKILKAANFYIEEPDLFTLRKFNRETGCFRLRLSRAKK